MQVPIRVVYLDRSQGALLASPGEADMAALNHHDFIPDACTGAVPRVHVLYRPGHYDILYLKRIPTT